MKRLKEIFAKNIVAHELKECVDCPSTEKCTDKMTIEQALAEMDETNPDNEEFKVVLDSVREWYKEKTGQELTE